MPMPPPASCTRRDGNTCPIASVTCKPSYCQRAVFLSGRIRVAASPASFTRTAAPGVAIVRVRGPSPAGGAARVMPCSMPPPCRRYHSVISPWAYCTRVPSSVGVTGSMVVSVSPRPRAARRSVTPGARCAPFARKVGAVRPWLFATAAAASAGSDCAATGGGDTHPTASRGSRAASVTYAHRREQRSMVAPLPLVDLPV